ncbi:hypothetical protein [Microbacterium deminutum]|uniref:Uncharacterized protein n=1 Tax=Microbacterium deminutum TaxID=344164 RepID=A0ABN2RF83_9MICO
MLTVLRTKPLLCTLNMWHHWHVESSPDGERHQRCITCGKDRTDVFSWRWDGSEPHIGSKW